MLVVLIGRGSQTGGLAGLNAFQSFYKHKIVHQRLYSPALKINLSTAVHELHTINVRFLPYFCATRDPQESSYQNPGISPAVLEKAT